MTPMAPLVPPALSRVGQTFHIAQLSVFCKKGGKNRDLATPSGIHEWIHVALQKNGWQTTNWEEFQMPNSHFRTKSEEKCCSKTVKLISKFIPKRFQINSSQLLQCDVCPWILIFAPFLCWLFHIENVDNEVFIFQKSIKSHFRIFQFYRKLKKHFFQL